MSDGLLVRLSDSLGHLGRHIWHDPQNRSFPIREMLREDAALTTKTWRVEQLFNQLSTSSCTMHAAAALLHAEPFAPKVGEKNLRAYNQHVELVSGYERSKRHDPWPGVNYDGTSTDAPLKMLRAEKRIKGWRWCFGLPDVLQTLSHYGPVSVGINWYDSMFNPDVFGRVHVAGSVAGGHCIALYAVDVEDEIVWGVNSWGDWGPLNGHFYLTFDDLRMLLLQDGEAATVVV